MPAVIFTPVCPHCKERGVVTVENTEGFERWMDGALIQDALPELTLEQREQIKTGYHPECWDADFGGLDA